MSKIDLIWRKLYRLLTPSSLDYEHSVFQIDIELCYTMKHAIKSVAYDDVKKRNKSFPQWHPLAGPTFSFLVPSSACKHSVRAHGSGDEVKNAHAR